MRPDGDGRFCDRCQLRVTEVATLDGAGLDELIASAERGRVCARLELEGGRVRTKLGLAAGLVVIALAGCATPDAPESQNPTDAGPAFAEFLRADPGAPGSRIAGVIRTPEHGFPIANAIVIVQSDALEAPREQMTDAHGFYKFDALPPGNYTIQVISGSVSATKITSLPENSRFVAHFSIDPDARRMVLGMVTEPTMIDTTSPASSYGSELIEYE